MSFLSRFTSLSRGKTIVPAVNPQPKKAAPTPSRIDETKARELIIEAKDQAFQIKRRADEDAQRGLGQAPGLTAEAQGRLSALEQREKNVIGQERHWQQELNQIEETKQQQLKKLQAIAKLSQ